jgi:hypothetical protein
MTADILLHELEESGRTRGGGWTEAESGVSQTSLGALLGAQTEAELTRQAGLALGSKSWGA